jgi:glutamate synthase (NADPH/NADH) small chain
MADPRGFLEVSRVAAPERDPRTRTADSHTIFGTLPADSLKEQGRRCMDCGIPFCHQGCPLGNLIPEWNDLVRRGEWHLAIDRLHATNNFPEFTGLICPAPCEASCVLAINDDPVMIKSIEWGIIERAFREGWVGPKLPVVRSGWSVGVVGSGPAGLAVAEELNAAGHRVVVYERDEGPGGLIRLGVPDFKLEKWIIDRRVALLEEAGIVFEYGVDVGSDLGIDELTARHDAVVLALGSRIEREIALPGRDLGGIHTAMSYLLQRNRAMSGQPAPPPSEVITAAGQHVIVIGGGDTAADCVASAHRERAASVTQLDIYPPPAGKKYFELAQWPDFPKRLWSTYALDEGGERKSAFNATEFLGVGHVWALRGDRVGDPPTFEPTGETHELPADLVLIAIGFTGVERGLVDQLGVDVGERGAIASTAFMTTADGVFACGDARRGQSLIVTAIAEGRQCAAALERYLTRAS